MRELYVSIGDRGAVNKARAAVQWAEERMAWRQAQEKKEEKEEKEDKDKEE